MQYSIYHIYASESNVFYVAHKNMAEVGGIPEDIFGTHPPLRFRYELAALEALSSGGETWALERFHSISPMYLQHL